MSSDHQFSFYIRNGIYYVRYNDPETGKRMSGISTRCTDERSATIWAVKYAQNNPLTTKSKLLFTEYTADWFIDGKCPHQRMSKKRNKQFSTGYMKNLRRILERHLIPYWGSKIISKITTSEIETFLDSLMSHEKNYATSTIHNIYNSLSLILNEAYRTGVLLTNPLDKVVRITKRSKEREQIPRMVSEEILNIEHIDKYWSGNIRYYYINLIALMTGLRVSEVQGLRRKSIDGAYIDLESSWGRSEGFKPPKYNSVRQLIIPTPLAKMIQDYLDEFVEDDPESLLFPGKIEGQPLGQEIINKKFKRALKIYGMSESDIKKGGFTFHSWRHTYISTLRGKIPEHMMKSQTGHKNENHMKPYTHIGREQLKSVQKNIDEAFSFLTKVA